MRDTQHTEIDGVHYGCTPLDGWEGVKLFFELLHLVGEPAMMMITRAFSEEPKIDEDGKPLLDDDGNPVGADVDAGAIVGAGVFNFFSKLDSATGLRVMKIVFAEIYTVQGKGDAQKKIELSSEGEFNLHFKGETLSALKVFVWAMQVNYQSFLEGSRLTGILGKLQAAMTMAKARPTTENEPTSTPETSPPSSSPPSASPPTEVVI